MADDPEFFQRILRAREAQQHAMVDLITEVVDAATPENWQVARLRMQSMQWQAARLAPTVYGEKSQINLMVTDALSERLTAAIKRQKELAGSAVRLQLEGVAEVVSES